MVDYHSLWISVGLQVLVFLALVILVISVGRTTPQWREFSHIGPSDGVASVVVCGFDVGNWYRWSGLMAMLLLLESVNTWSHKTYARWYKQRICRDPGGPHQIPPPASLSVITIWELATFAPKALEWFIFVSNPQLQFLVPPLVARVIVSNMMDYSIMYRGVV